MSLRADAVARHALRDDLDVNEFDVVGNELSSELQRTKSLYDILESQLVGSHCENPKNFSESGTAIECLKLDDTFRGRKSPLYYWTRKVEA